MSSKISLLSVSILMACFPALSQNRFGFRPGEALKRPTVAVVLSGGGAKGVAHIGVFKYLEELGIPVDMVVGTSMGSIIGGLYSLGYNAEEMDSLVKAQDWDYLISDRFTRENLNYEQKKEKEQYLLSVPFKNAESFREDLKNKDDRTFTDAILGNIPPALVEGQNLYNLFTKLSVGYQDSVDFNSFPVRFACVAVDMNGQKEVVFHNGNFARAIRASMAIPGYFAPVRYEGMYLVDGGVLNNFPVDVAREMGADIIIGVDLHYKKSNKPNKVNNILDEVSGMLKLLERNKYQQNVKDVDILITPDVEMYGTMDFDIPTMNAMRDSGYVAAVREKGDLEMLARSLKERESSSRSMVAHVRSKAPKAINIDHDSVEVADIEVRGLDAKDATWLIRKTDLLNGNRISGKDIDAAIRMFYMTGAFQSVTYTLNGSHEPYHMVITFVPGLVHTFNFGFRFDSEETAAMLLNVSLDRLKLYGPRLDLTARLSYNSFYKVNAAYTFRNLAQVNIGASFKQSNLNIYENESRATNIQMRHVNAELSFQTKNLKRSKLLFGMRYENYYYNNALADTGLWLPSVYKTTNDGHYDYLSSFVNYSFDSYDKAYFPTRGTDFFIEYSYYPDFFQNKVDFNSFQSLSFRWKKVFPIGGRLALIFQMYGSSVMPFSLSDTLSKIPASHMNMIGGYQEGKYSSQQMPFVGTHNVIVTDRLTFIPRIDMRVNFGKGNYLTLMANYMQSSGNYYDFLEDSGHYGFGIGYSYDSFFGPLTLNFHWSDLQKFGAYLSLGYYF
ncbi:MAG: patatin-like phospholipase family protein [Bacteroidales bacterium]|nr:patatin-like phospholipase family protein [Bacteroidales bacterium]